MVRIKKIIKERTNPNPTIPKISPNPRSDKITNHKSQIKNHKSKIKNHKSKITNQKSQIKNHHGTQSKF
jgi:hypothetical protein